MAEWFIDTNLLLRSAQPESSDCECARSALDILAASGADLFVSLQVIAEFWCVATRPVDVNGLGWSSDAVAAEVEMQLGRLLVLTDTPANFSIWLDLVRIHAIKGKKVHDARLVAVMKAHGVENLLTFNVDDFKAYQEINAVHPASVVQGS